MSTCIVSNVILVLTITLLRILSRIYALNMFDIGTKEPFASLLANAYHVKAYDIQCIYIGQKIIFFCKFILVNDNSF